MLVAGDVQAGPGLPAGPAHLVRAQRLRGDLLPQLGHLGGEDFGGRPGPEPGAVGARDDAVVAAAPPVAPVQPETGNHLALGEQRALVQRSGKLFPAGDQLIDRRSAPSRGLLQVIGQAARPGRPPCRPRTTVQPRTAAGLLVVVGAVVRRGRGKASPARSSVVMAGAVPLPDNGGITCRRAGGRRCATGRSGHGAG